MSPIPLTVERGSYFSLIFSLLLSLFLSLSFVFLFFSLVSSISSCLFCGSFKGEERILLSSAWHKIPQQRECHDEGFSHAAHNEVRVSQYILLGVVSLYFKPRSKLCSFHFQKSLDGLLGSSEVPGRRKLAFMLAAWGEAWLWTCLHACVCHPASLGSYRARDLHGTKEPGAEW